MLNRIWTIAKRDYLAAVKTKGFIIGLFLMPVMMFGGLVIGRLTRDFVDVTDKRVAVIDRTPGEAILPTLLAAAEQRNAELVDEKTGRQKAAKFLFERVPPAALDDEAAVEAQRLELSERIRKDELFAFIEIGKDVLSVSLPKVPTAEEVRAAREAAASVSAFDLDARIDAAAKALGEAATVRYTTNRPTYGDVRAFVQEKVAVQAQAARAAALNLSPAMVMAAARPPLVANAPPYFRDATGKVQQESRQGQVMSFIMPFALLFLLFIVVLIGASPLTTNVVEEKQLRIAEVLLGSVPPFHLMMGKLLGGVGVALTLAVVYLVGGYLGAREFGIAKYLTPGMIAAFVLFTVLATLMYGGLFVAAGAAVTNIKEAQSLITPVMLLVMLPLFFFQPMLNDPSGPIARAATFFPFSAPMVTVMRLGIPPGLAAWEIALAAVITLATTLAIVWAAGRVFRVGILMQGQAAGFRQLVRWVVAG